MCEYCGCQDIRVIEDLTREHDAVVDLIAQIESSIAHNHLDSVVRRCRLISAILTPHRVVEEEGLYPELVDAFPDHIEVMRFEHRQIEQVLAEATHGLPTDPTWPDRLVDTLYLLREHILKEQDGVFPAALAALDASQWERIEAVRQRISPATATWAISPATATWARESATSTRTERDRV